jgi:two-component system CheB/CheR fusion protein
MLAWGVLVALFGVNAGVAYYNALPLLDQETGNPAYRSVLVTAGIAALMGLGAIGAFVLVWRRYQRWRFRANETVRRATEQLQIVTDTMSALVTRCSRDFKYLWVSKPYAEWLGRPAHEPVGRPIVEIIGEQAFGQLRPHFEKVLAGQVVRYEERVDYERIGPRWVNAAYMPTRDARGVPDGWVAVVTDITERRQLEDNLRRSEEALKEADRKKDEFLAVLAHELRNPLAPIRNGLQLIRLAGEDDKARDQASAMMERQLSQLVRLVDDLLDVSRIANGKIELRREPVELARVLEQALEISRPMINAAGHDLTVAMPPPSIVVDADVNRIAQVFSNLLNNAAKYTPEGGHLWLVAERQGSDVLVTVKDNGMGMVPETLSRVFEMFAQGERALERAEGGLGIGLTLVKAFVEMHGGTVEAQSNGPGHGAEFKVRLPVLVSPEVTRPLEVRKDGSSFASTCRILIVDDNRDSAESLAMILRIQGNEVASAYDGLEAVARAEDFGPDVILLDIGLPKLNGYEAARRIRDQEWGKDLVLIAVTGWGQEEDRRCAKESGFNHHLVKPVDPAALEGILAGIHLVSR